MIVLITGVIGHGKTQKAVQMALDYIAENDKRLDKDKEPRQLYGDIAGINEDGVTPLPMIVVDSEFDWRETPEESVIFYDECQQKDWIRDKAGTLSDDPRVRAMETSRHGQRDIILICQDAKYIHTHIRGLVSPHFHCVRPLGASFTNIYKYNAFQLNPASATKKADDQNILYLSKKYGQYYKSAVAHNEKFVIPNKIKIVVVLAVIVSLLAVYKVYNVFTDKKNSHNPKEIKEIKEFKNHPTAEQQMQKTLATELDRVLSPREDQELLKVKYQKNIVYETAYDEDIRPAMAISTKNKCIATNSYGEPLNIDYKTCVLMSKNNRLLPARRTVQNESLLDGFEEGTKDATALSPLS